MTKKNKIYFYLSEIQTGIVMNVVSIPLLENMMATIETLIHIETI